MWSKRVRVRAVLRTSEIIINEILKLQHGLDSLNLKETKCRGDIAKGFPRGELELRKSQGPRARKDMKAAEQWPGTKLLHLK